MEFDLFLTCSLGAALAVTVFYAIKMLKLDCEKGVEATLLEGVFYGSLVAILMNLVGALYLAVRGHYWASGWLVAVVIYPISAATSRCLYLLEKKKEAKDAD